MKILLTIILLSSFSTCLNAKPKATPIYSGEDVVWGFDFLNDSELLITHRSGKLVHYNIKTKKKAILSSPNVYPDGQGGLLDIQIYEGYIYITFSEKIKDKEVTSLARKKLGDKDFKTIFQSNAHGGKDIHFGSRLAFKDQHLFMTIGDRSERDLAQSLKHHNGKVIRLNLDGSIPKDNPYINNLNALNEIWSYGHRNPQGLGFDPISKKLFEVEFGPRGGDEVNIIEPKNNYGWPVITYGKEYWGPSIGSKEKKGMMQPLVYWVPSISPSGMNFYTGSKIKEWKNNLFLACLGSEHLRRLVLKDNKVVSQEELFKELEERIRFVKTGKDGYLYFSTDSGKVFKVE